MTFPSPADDSAASKCIGCGAAAITPTAKFCPDCMCTNGETTQLARRQGCGFGGYALAAMMAVAVAVALPAVAQNVPPSHYLKVYWLAKDDTVNFMVVDDENDRTVYECEIHGQVTHTCTIPPNTYEVTDFSQAAIKQEPAQERTVYFQTDDFWEATFVRDLPVGESVTHALHNPFGREDR